MSKHGSNNVDYPPLADLIGNWVGDKGLDQAPEPDGLADTPIGAGAPTVG